MALVRTVVSEKHIASIIIMLQMLVTPNAVPTSLILFTLMMWEICSSEIGSYKSHTVSYPRSQHTS
jgi:hypothetical protein